MTPDPDDRTTDATQAAEERDAQVHGQADRPPTDEEAAVAAQHRDAAGAGVAEHYEEMAEIGAEVRGEGQIEP